MKQARRAPVRRIDALSEIAQAVAQVGTPEEWARRVVAVVARATGWYRVFIFRLSGEELLLLAAHGITAEQEHESRSMRVDGPSLSARAVARGEVLVAGRSEIGDEAAANMRRLGTRSYAVFPLVARGRVFGCLTLLDARRRRVSEQELSFLKAVTDTLATGLESAELYGASQAASRAKDDFLSIASHELRTPLTPLKGLAQSLLRHIERNAGPDRAVDLDRVVRALRTIDGQVDRLSALVNDLLDVSRIRTGRLELRRAETDLVGIAAGILERFEHGELSTALRARPALRLVRQAERLTGLWDAARLEQVATNLIDNAIKYGPPGGEVVVTVGPAVGRDGRDGWASMSVRDQGIGIPAGQIKELFGPFARLRNASAEQYGGIGLGLYISRDIVERHGGLIWAESPGPGEGSTFHVLLPCGPVGSSEGAAGALHAGE